MRTQDIISKVFTRSFMGYDIEEVDRFLDAVIDCIEQYEAEKKEMMTAMEYLLQKLENDTQMPAAEIREAIDTGKPAKKRAVLPEKTKNVRIPAKRTDKSATKQRTEEQDVTEAKATARSITRGGKGAPKPVRAPKVSRVAAQQPQTGTKTDEPASAQAFEGGNWLDELLDNLSERDKKGYTTVPEQSAARTVTATQENVQPPKKQTAETLTNDQPKRAQAEPQPLKAQPVTEKPKESAPPASPKLETTPQTAQPQPTAQASGEQREPPSVGPQKTESETEEAIRSFEATLRTLGETVRKEPAKPDENRPAQNDTTETYEHKPKHAAVSEDEKQ